MECDARYTGICLPLRRHIPEQTNIYFQLYESLKLQVFYLFIWYCFI